MGKATIISELGGGQYTITRNWAGRPEVDARFIAYVAEAVKLDEQYQKMPQTTDEELFKKNIVKLQIQSLIKKAAYLRDNMPDDKTVNAWCADYTEGLTGEVGTIDIAGEFTADVNIRPGYTDEDEIDEQIDELNAELKTLNDELRAIPKETPKMASIKYDINLRQGIYEDMPETTPEEMAAKASYKKIIDNLRDEYDMLYGVQAALIAAKKRQIKNVEETIKCLQNTDTHYCAAVDGHLYPAIALGPWTTFLNNCIYPGWQKFAPLHRYAKIVEYTIDHVENTCVVAVQPTFNVVNYHAGIPATRDTGDPPAASRRATSKRTKDQNVNVGDPLGREEIEVIQAGVSERNAARNWFYQDQAYSHPGLLDFIQRRPDHPISNIGKINPPVFITDEQYIQISRICRHIDYFFYYESDYSGYEVSDKWNVMYEIGDPWYWTPSFAGESQSELTFGNISLEYDDSGLIVGLPDLEQDREYLYQFGYGRGSGINWYTDLKHLELEFAAMRLNEIGPRPRSTGDCEDFAMTKMQAIYEAGILGLENMQILLCYVYGAGYHAVLGINTSNYGYLISDQREYGQLWQIEQLSTTHHWASFTAATAAGESVNAQVILQDVPFEYMDCNSQAFTDNDDVIIEFEGQSWENPKVIGFRDSPRLCSNIYIFPAFLQFKYETESRTMRVSYYSESWAWKPAFPRNYDFGRVDYAATGDSATGIIAGGNKIEFSGERSQSYNHVDLFDSVAETFSIANTLPQSKGNLGIDSLKNGKAIATGGGLYLGVGQGIDPSQVFPDTHEYTISTNSYVTKQSDREIFDHARFIIGGYLHTVCGANLTVFPNTSANSLHRIYFDIADSWASRTTCPQSSYKRVNGWNINGYGLIGGGALLTDPTDEDKVQTTGQTYLYDEATYSWNRKADAISGFGCQASSSAVGEQVALNFGACSGGNLLNWYAYTIDTNNWTDKGIFGLTVSDDPIWYSNRSNADGCELSL